MRRPAQGRQFVRFGENQALTDADIGQNPHKLEYAKGQGCGTENLGSDAARHDQQRSETDNPRRRFGRTECHQAAHQRCSLNSRNMIAKCSHRVLGLRSPRTFQGPCQNDETRDSADYWRWLSRISQLAAASAANCVILLLHYANPLDRRSLGGSVALNVTMLNQ